MLLASLLFAFMGGFVKILTQSLNSVEVVFFRNFVGFVIILYSIYKKPLKQIGGKFYLLFFRGFIGFISLLFFFYSFGEIAMANAVTLNKTSPIFVAIFSYIFLKEKLSGKAWLGVFVGFIGIVFMSKATGFSMDKANVLGLLGGIGAALAYTSIRELKKFYETRAIVLSFMAIGSIGPFILMIIGQFYTNEKWSFIISPFIMPSPKEWVMALFIGIFATISQLLMTKAYSLSKGGIVASISYTNIAFAAIIGYFLGDKLFDFDVLIGIMLIIFSGLLVSLKGKK